MEPPFLDNQLLDVINQVLGAQGRAHVDNTTLTLRDIGFRSLDFAETALRVEDLSGSELNFETVELSHLETVQDVVNYFSRVIKNSA